MYAYVLLQNENNEIISWNETHLTFFSMSSLEKGYVAIQIIITLIIIKFFKDFKTFYKWPQ